MKLYLKILLASLLLLPLAASAATNVPWSLQNISDTFIFPNLVNGSAKGVIVNASSTINAGLTITGSATTTGWAYFGSNVGIGTSTPEFSVDLWGSTSASAYYTTRVSNDSQPSGFIARKARGTTLAPSAALFNDSLAVFGARGYGATGWGANSSIGGITIRAAQNFTDSAKGTMISFETTPLNSLTRVTAMVLDSTGNLGVGSSTPWKQLSVGTGNTGTFAISTSTAGCAQLSAQGELFSTGVACGSGSATPGGLNTQLQYNNAGVFGGITGATTNGTAVSLSGAHLLNPTINGAGAGLATLTYPNTASSVTITFPSTTDTLATLAGTEALTNKSVNGVTLTTAGSATTFLNGAGAYTTPSTFAYPFPILGIGTSTGLMLLGSTTIGGGTQTTGLTVSGGATTTGISYLANNVAIGSSTNGVAPVALEFKPTISTSGSLQTLIHLNYSGAGGTAGDGVTINGPDNTARIGFVAQSGYKTVFYTNSLERMRIGTDGNVGIGTTTPWKLLAVGTNNVGTFAISTSTAGCAQFSSLGELYSTGSGCGAGGGSAFAWTPTNNFGVNTNATSTTLSLFAGFNASSTSHIASTTFDVSGFVGVGTTTNNFGGSIFSTVITNAVAGLGGLLINMKTNATNALTILNAAGAMVFNIDTTSANPFHGVGTSTPWGTLSAVGNGTSPIFAVATSSNTGLPNFEIDAFGHEVTSGPKPTCTTNCTLLAGNDNAFRITTGTAVLTETITFSHTWGTNAPICQATEGGNTTSPIVIAASTTPTTVVLTNAALTTKDVDVSCIGIQ